MSTYFTADLHVGHARIIELSYRPFPTLDDMHQALITNWNNTVASDDDIVWVLGDLSIDSKHAEGIELMKQVKGRKRMIFGNHDRGWAGKRDCWKVRNDYNAVFEHTAEFARTKVHGAQVMLSHFPIAGDHTEEARFDGYRLRDNDLPLVHGHTHAHGAPVSFTSKGQRQIHIGVDAWNYAPVTEHQVFDLLDSPQLAL